MELVVDANILLAGFMKTAVTRELLLDSRLKLHAPEYLVYETRKHLLGNSDLKRRIGLSASEIDKIWFLLTQNIESHAQGDYQKAHATALKLAPHAEDAPYLALALSMNIPVWSNDKAMAMQPRIRILTTRDILVMLR
ncbi:MAG TPA: PIN domain-containing protein [Candidatus Omnitrophota bacterium]|mgnify:CR=1 FL=1|nr:PIN domain-containing protein [Candidatus Omnitrophota bacterium]HPS36266.1 PIN domain-containing protein [Candidatus Omnitrophota bacterium]